MPKLKIYSVLSFVFIGVIVVTIIFSPLPSFTALPAQATIFGLTTPLGGKVLFVAPCTCQYTSWMLPKVVYVGPPKGGVFLQTIFTRLYSNYSVSPGKSVLGLASNVKMPCMDTAGWVCSARVGGPYQTILMIGTSLK